MDTRSTTRATIYLDPAPGAAAEGRRHRRSISELVVGHRRDVDRTA
jgi:hypothetical protein